MAEPRTQEPAPPFATETASLPASPITGLKTELPVVPPFRTRVRGPVPAKATAPVLAKVNVSVETPLLTSITPPAAPRVRRRLVEAATPR